MPLLDEISNDALSESALAKSARLRRGIRPAANRSHLVSIFRLIPSSETSLSIESCANTSWRLSEGFYSRLNDESIRTGL